MRLDFEGRFQTLGKRQEEFFRELERQSGAPHDSTLSSSGVSTDPGDLAAVLMAACEKVGINLTFDYY